jgi:hypothetical protein
MKKINEDKICSDLFIDLSKLKQNRLDESYLTALGTAVEYSLAKMFAGSAGNLLRLRGTSSEIGAFLAALTAEKKYLEKFISHGLADQRTYDSRYRLEDAIRKFERETGLKWPVK